MSSGVEHRIGGAIALFLAAAADWKPDDHQSKHPVVAAGLGAACATLPDIFEPALHPSHRQFWHSIAFAAVLGCGLYEVYHWEPETDGERIARSLVLIAGCTYLTHLAFDATTPKSLPLLGRL